MQAIASEARVTLSVHNLMANVKGDREVEVRRLIHRLILSPVDVMNDPLFGASLVRMSENEHVLILALEHSIADAFSMGILLRELSSQYTRSLTGRPSTPPPVLTQYYQHCIRQRLDHELWKKREGIYWEKRLSGCGRLRFPFATSKVIVDGDNWAETIQLHISRSLKRELVSWSRLYKTTLAMCMLTTFAALVLRWCNVFDVVLQYQIDGRSDHRVENTIGYFASVLFLRIELDKRDSFIGLLSRVTGEYCSAYRHADSSYLESQHPRPEFARNSWFNWIPKSCEVNLSDLDGTENAITCNSVSFENPAVKRLQRDTEPGVAFFDGDEDISGVVWFPKDRFSIEVMERFARNFFSFLSFQLERPGWSVCDVSLV
jgi:hypothetical protein